MARISKCAVDMAEATLFIKGNGFSEFRHGLYIYLAIAELPGGSQTFIDQQASQALTSDGGDQIHFYQLAYGRR